MPAVAEPGMVAVKVPSLPAVTVCSSTALPSGREVRSVNVAGTPVSEVSAGPSFSSSTTVPDTGIGSPGADVPLISSSSTARRLWPKVVSPAGSPSATTRSVTVPEGQPASGPRSTW